MKHSKERGFSTWLDEQLEDADREANRWFGEDESLYQYWDGQRTAYIYVINYMFNSDLGFDNE